MSARKLDPLVWAATYGAMAALRYVRLHETADGSPIERRAEALLGVESYGQVNALIADAAARGLRLETAPSAPAPAAEAAVETMHAWDPDASCVPCSTVLGAPSPCAISHDFGPGAYPVPAADPRDRAWAALVNAIEATWDPVLQGQHAVHVTAAIDALRLLGVDVDGLIDTVGRGGDGATPATGTANRLAALEAAERAYLLAAGWIQKRNDHGADLWTRSERQTACPTADAIAIQRRRDTTG